MKMQPCVCASFAAILLLGSLGALDAQAFGRRSYYASPGVNYYYSPGPIGGGMGLPYYAPGVSYYPEPGAYHGYGYNPYIAPYPAYGILPPPFATMQMLGMDPFNPKRSSDMYRPVGPRTGVSPPLPYDPPSPPVPRADARRVKFIINVPKEDAVVTFDGADTKQKGLTRTFQTPALQEDRLYSSKIEVIWTDQGGKIQDRKEEKQFKAGETISITFK